MENANPHRRRHVLTWHIHGSYLYYLAQAPHEFYLPVLPGRPEGYGGRTSSYPWPANVHEVPANEVKYLELDCILYQSRKNYLEDQYDILSREQLALPRIYLEHDPPREHPTDTSHLVDDPEILLVHVTHFNNLMWESGRTPTRVIEHGVIVPNGIHYSGELDRGIVVVNGLLKRGRRLGLDIFEKVREEVPLDLVGIDSEQLGGLGSYSHAELAALESRYRFFFNPIRYTSLGLSVCEAMMVGMPVIGVATTEMSTAIENGISGYVDTDVDMLIGHMQWLLSDREEARRIGEGALRRANTKFNIRRFISDWNNAFAWIISRSAMKKTPVLKEID